MAGLVLVLGLGGLVAAFLVIGNLGRIAEAIEKQNKHYGIGEEPEKAAKPEEVA